MNPLIALPTASGKTIVLAELIAQAINRYNVNVLVISHIKEIIEQDERALAQHLAPREINVFSAGMGRKEIGQVTVASIQSIFKKSELFQRFKFVIIDEAHCLSSKSESMYRKFLSQLNSPRVLGLTATPYRLGSGYIYGGEDHLFDSLIYDLTSKDSFLKLIEDGYLCPIRSYAPNLELDTTDIHTAGGEFIEAELSMTFDREGITDAIIKEAVPFINQCKKALIFAIDIKHAEHIAEKLTEHGVSTHVVHSKMETDRDHIIQKFKDGELKVIVNINILTVGFDNPEIDLIILIRPTQSPVLHVQTIGRGLRIAPGKTLCTVLDFAGNVGRLGPINDVRVINKGKRKGDGEPMVKTCPECRTLCHLAARICSHCGYAFPIKHNLTGTAGVQQIIADNSVQDHKVTAVSYKIHNKKNSPSSLKVTYTCGLRTFNEWVCLNHKGFARVLAKNWVSVRVSKSEDISNEEHCRMTESIDDLLKYSGKLAVPTFISIKEAGKYPNIVKHTFCS